MLVPSDRRVTHDIQALLAHGDADGLGDGLVQARGKGLVIVCLDQLVDLLTHQLVLAKFIRDHVQERDSCDVLLHACMHA